MPPTINPNQSVLPYDVGQQWIYAPKAIGADTSTNPQWSTDENLAKALPVSTVATITALPTCTYNHGALGVGATLTATANGALTVDAITAVAGDLVAVKNEASALRNGLYIVTDTGSAGTPWILTRHPEMNSTAKVGGYTEVLLGATNAGRIYLAPPEITELGVSPVTWQQWKNRWYAWNVPPGMIFNVATGMISGAASVPGVYITGIRASSDSGVTWSAEAELTIGIDDPTGVYSAEGGAPVDITIDAGTGAVSLSSGDALVITLNDVRILRIAFTFNGARVDLGELKSLRMAIKDFEMDDPLYIGGGHEADGEEPPLYGSIGTGPARVYLMAVQYGATFYEALEVAGREKEAKASVRAEIEWRATNSTGVGPAVLRQSSRQFDNIVYRDFVPNS